jgi:hypothetical protein
MPGAGGATVRSGVVERALRCLHRHRRDGVTGPHGEIPAVAEKLSKSVSRIRHRAVFTVTGPGRFVEGPARPRPSGSTRLPDAVRDRGGGDVVVTDIGPRPVLARVVHGPVSVRGNLTGPHGHRTCGRSGSACRSRGTPGSTGSPGRGHDGGQRLRAPAPGDALVLGLAGRRGASAARPSRGLGRRRPCAPPPRAPRAPGLPQGPRAPGGRRHGLTSSALEGLDSSS